MNPLCEEYHHRAAIRYDGSDTVTFKWHWPRGTFDARMSALELAQFVLPHMPHIAGFFVEHPVVHAHFLELLNRLALWPEQVLDEVLPWIRRLEFTEEDEILQLDLGAKALPNHSLIFDMGRRECP